MRRKGKPLVATGALLGAIPLVWLMAGSQQGSAQLTSTDGGVTITITVGDGGITISDGGIEIGDGGMFHLTSDGQVVGVLQAFNTGMAQLAQTAQTKSSSPTVQAYAKMQAETYTFANTSLSLTGIAAEPTPLSQALPALFQQELATLNTLSGTRFDAAYLAATITNLAGVKEIFDEELTSSTAASSLVDAGSPDAGTLTGAVVCDAILAAGVDGGTAAADAGADGGAALSATGLEQACATRATAQANAFYAAELSVVGAADGGATDGGATDGGP